MDGANKMVIAPGTKLRNLRLGVLEKSMAARGHPHNFNVSLEPP